MARWIGSEPLPARAPDTSPLLLGLTAVYRQRRARAIADPGVPARQGCREPSPGLPARPERGCRPELGLSLAHQFDFTSIHYRVAYARVFAERTLGQSIDHNKLDLELGYFVNDAWTVKLFGSGKKGNGYGGPYDPTTELFYHHDQRAPHNYASVGFGVDRFLGDKYVLSTSLQHEVWGYAIFNFKYNFELRLTRFF